MRIYKFFFFFFFISISFAQIKIDIQDDLLVTYKYEFKKRVSSEKNSIELMVLAIEKNESSTFLSKSSFIIDSIQKIRPIAEGDIKIIATSNSYLIKRKKNLIVHSEYFANEVFQFAQVLNLDWVLQNEGKVINGIKCRKATLVFEGREWIAWYATNIAVSAGPYKFYGLPGLIYEMYDTENTFNFSVISIAVANLNANLDVLNYFIRGENKSINTIKSNVFFKTRKKFYLMSFDEQTAFINKSEFGVITAEVTTLTGEKVNTNRNPKERNFIERFD